VKIQGDNGSDDDDDDTDGGVEDIKTNAFKELCCLERDDDIGSHNGEGAGCFGIMMQWYGMHSVSPRPQMPSGMQYRSGEDVGRGEDIAPGVIWI
jgi:hypothetical protein